jgi:hypothetical protein
MGHIHKGIALELPDAGRCGAAGVAGKAIEESVVDIDDPPLPGKLTPLHSNHFNHQGA